MSEIDACLIMDRAQALYLENPSTENAEHFLNTAKALRDQNLITDADIAFVIDTVTEVLSHAVPVSSC